MRQEATVGEVANIVAAASGIPPVVGTLHIYVTRVCLCLSSLTANIAMRLREKVVQRQFFVVPCYVRIQKAVVSQAARGEQHTSNPWARKVSPLALSCVVSNV